MMKNKFLPVAAALCIAACGGTAISNSLTARAENTGAASRSVLIDNCDAAHAFNGSADYVNKKRGFGSLRYSGNNLWFTGAFGAADTSEIPFEKARLEFWLYTEQADLFGDGQIELNSSGKIDDLNDYHWPTSSLTLRKGWNFVSLPFSAAVKSGAVDYGALDYMRFYQFSANGASLEAWIDEIRITDTETAVDESELGIPPAAPGIEEPTEEEIRDAWKDYLDEMMKESARADRSGEIENASLAFGIGGGVLLAGLAATAVLLVMKKRKGERK